MGKIRARPLFTALFSGLVPFFILATTKSFAAGSKSGVSATVTTDGALVYSAPDEQSAVITQFQAGAKVQISKGTTQGPEKFHKIRVGARIGYIDDIDVAIEGAGSPIPPNGQLSKKAAGKDKRDAKKRKHAKLKKQKPNDPFYFSRFVGLEVGSSEYKEGILNVNSSTTFVVYGLKITGPDVLFKGPVMDINLLLHYGAPSYYAPISATQANGFVLFTDAMFVLPLFQRQDGMLFLAAGPLLVISKFGVLNTGRLMDLDSIDAGIDASIGGAVRVEKVAIRLEAKYYLEKQSYKAFLASIQTQF